MATQDRCQSEEKTSGNEFPKPPMEAIDRAPVDVRRNHRSYLGSYRARRLARHGAECQELHAGDRRSVDQQVRRRQARLRAGRRAGSKDLERIRPFVPPGWFEQLNFPEFKMEIMAARSHVPRKDFQECTEKYQAQVKLNPDGSLANYVCGQPFPDASLNTSDALGNQSGVEFRLSMAELRRVLARTISSSSPTSAAITTATRPK